MSEHEPWRPLVFSPKGGQLVFQEFLSCSVWNLMADPPTHFQISELMPQFCASFSPDGATVAVGYYTGKVDVHDTSSGQRIISLQSQTEPIDSLAFSRDGKTLLSGCRDGTVAFWDAATGQLRATFRHHVGSSEMFGGVASIAMSPTADTIATRGGDGTIKVWRTATPQNGEVKSP